MPGHVIALGGGGFSMEPENPLLDEYVLSHARGRRVCFVGTARLHGVDEHDRRARYAVGLLDSSRLGMGLGSEVTRTVLGYAFDELGLHRVDLRVLAYNTRAIRCYERCGFVEEGREREAAFVDGHWHDDVIMGILQSELTSRITTGERTPF